MSSDKKVVYMVSFDEEMMDTLYRLRLIWVQRNSFGFCLGFLDFVKVVQRICKQAWRLGFFWVAFSWRYSFCTMTRMNLMSMT